MPESASGIVNASGKGQESLLPGQDGSSWRKEVSDRLNRYHARRRPRPPRYPSLRLKFEQPESRWAAQRSRCTVARRSRRFASLSSDAAGSGRELCASRRLKEHPLQKHGRLRSPRQFLSVRRNDSTGKLIEFPRHHLHTGGQGGRPGGDDSRSTAHPGGSRDRSPAARVGWDDDRGSRQARAGTASRDRHAAAVGVCRAKVLGGFNRRSTGTRGRCSVRSNLLQGREPGADACTNCRRGEPVCWSLVGRAYQYLLVVYSGSTPGLRVLHLQLQRFDGIP